MCLIRDCTNKKENLIGDWHLTDRLCETHYLKIKNYLTSNDRYAIEPGLLSDYIGLKAMMIEQKTVMSHLRALASEVHSAVQMQKKSPQDWDDRFRTSRPDRGYVRLSRVLENYEGYCWFPACHRIFVAGLSGEDFYWYIAHGFMVKDPGPDTRHGDFTHRYQWHAVMRHLTEGFTKPKGGGFWLSSPLDLFTSLGKSPAKEAGIWGKIFDRDDASPPDVVDYNTFSNPNNLHFALCDAGFDELSKNTERRLLKRRSAAEFAQTTLDRYSKSFGHEWKQWMFLKADPSYSDLAGLLYSWRKNGGQPLGIDKNLPNPPVKDEHHTESSKEFFERQKAWSAKARLANAAKVAEWIYETDINEGEVGELKYKNGQPHYQFIVTPESAARFSVLAESDAMGDFTSVTDIDIGQRITLSRSSFDVGRYNFGNTGATKHHS
jgi:hypothetical protein